MDIASKHRVPLADSRGHHELRRPPTGGWMLVDGGRPLHPHPPPWVMHGGPPPAGTGLLKQVGQNSMHGGSYPAKYHPYNMYQRHSTQFTIRDLEKCLYGKQDMRVVQIGDQKCSPPSKQSEDKNKPAKWCDSCQEIRFGECPEHDGTYPTLPPLTLSGPKSYAVSTFPDEVGLCISTLPLAGYGVFAKQFIPMGTWIGPYEGKKIAVEDGLKQISHGDAPFLWEIYENLRLSHFLDASDENASSWMRFIQCARHRGEQNLFVFQYYGSIYYRAFKDIAVGSELLVWYDDKYPQYFGMPYDIRDMSSFSMESIQAPTEVPKKPEFDPTRTPHGERSHPFLHGGKVVPNTGPGSRERNEPPRIPPNGHMLTHGHPSNTFQPPLVQPPAQPPTLSQAPSITDSRSSHPTNHLSASRPHAHSIGPPGHSPRPSNAVFRREPPHASSNMLRSMSADDLRKRNSIPGDRPSSEREHSEHIPHGSDRARHPSPGLLGGHMNLLHGPLSHHYPAPVTFSKLPPSVMSVAPATYERSRIKLDELGKHGELKLYHDRERAAFVREQDRVLQERERIAREQDRVLHERERLAIERGRQLRERSMHDGNTATGEGREIYRCQVCRQSFSQKIAFEKHHCASEAAKPFQCGRCQLSFTESADLQEHMAMHNSERHFKCGVCSRSFSGAPSLSAHMRSHTMNEPKLPPKEIMKTPPLDCHKCGKRFVQTSDLNKHFTTPGECVS